MNEKDIRFVAVDANDPCVQNFLNQGSSYVEIDKGKFDYRLDGMATSNERFNNVTQLNGRLYSDPQKMISHTKFGDRQVVLARLAVPGGYYDKNGAHHETREIIPIRFYRDLDKIMMAEKGDFLHVVGRIKSYIDPKGSEEGATNFMYVLVESFIVDFSSSIRKKVKNELTNGQGVKRNGNGQDQLLKALKDATPELKQQVLAMLSQNAMSVPSEADTSAFGSAQAPSERNVAAVENPIVSEAVFENDNTQEKAKKDAWDVTDQELQNTVIDFI